MSDLHAMLAVEFWVFIVTTYTCLLSSSFCISKINTKFSGLWRHFPSQKFVELLFPPQVLLLLPRALLPSVLSDQLSSRHVEAYSASPTHCESPLVQGGFFNWPPPDNVSRLGPPKFAWTGPP